MLVLSRRQTQKVLFPSLDISVEVLGFNGKQVRLGINAPPEIRVIRDELTPDNGQPVKRLGQQEIQTAFDAASLALQLAKNQLRQGLVERADEAIGHAIECLAGMKPANQNRPHVGDHPVECALREDKPRYLSHKRQLSEPPGLLAEASQKPRLDETCLGVHKPSHDCAFHCETNLSVVG